MMTAGRGQRQQRATSRNAIWRALADETAPCEVKAIAHNLPKGQAPLALLKSIAGTAYTDVESLVAAKGPVLALLKISRTKNSIAVEVKPWSPL